jgi:hypothetical protein
VVVVEATEVAEATIVAAVAVAVAVMMTGVSNLGGKTFVMRFICR